MNEREVGDLAEQCPLPSSSARCVVCRGSLRGPYAQLYSGGVPASICIKCCCSDGLISELVRVRTYSGPQHPALVSGPNDPVGQWYPEDPT
jgi:hypothetical protein